MAGLVKFQGTFRVCATKDAEPVERLIKAQHEHVERELPVAVRADEIVSIENTQDYVDGPVLVTTQRNYRVAKPSFEELVAQWEKALRA